MRAASTHLPFFANRSEAGKELATKLEHYQSQANVWVLGLARGGIPVAFEIARKLRAPLDVLIIRKLGVPGNEELAMGAIANGGVIVMNDEICGRLSQTQIDGVVTEQGNELQRREKLYRGNRPPLTLKGIIAIITDDGLATGASMRAAIQAAKQLLASRIVVAVPVVAREVLEKMQSVADELVYLHAPMPFSNVSRWYEDFPQVEDAEVLRLLSEGSYGLNTL